MSAFSVKTDVRCVSELRRKFALGGPVQIAVDEAVVRFSKPYMPYDSGVLSNSAPQMTQYGSGVVIWPGPYAHFMYIGDAYKYIPPGGGPSLWWAPKGTKKTNMGFPLKYNTEHNKDAGPRWVDRMKVDRINDIIKEAANAI